MSLSTTCWGGDSGVSMVPASAPSAPTCRCRPIWTGPLMTYSQSPASEAAPLPAFFCSASAALQSASAAQISINRAAREIARSIICKLLGVFGLREMTAERRGRRNGRLPLVVLDRIGEPGAQHLEPIPGSFDGLARGALPAGVQASVDVVIGNCAGHFVARRAAVLCRLLLAERGLHLVDGGLWASQLTERVADASERREHGPAESDHGGHDLGIAECGAIGIDGSDRRAGRILRAAFVIGRKGRGVQAQLAAFSRFHRLFAAHPEILDDGQICSPREMARVDGISREVG